MLKEQPSTFSFPEVSLQSIFEQNLPVDRVFDELCGRVTLSIRRKNKGRIPDNFDEIFPDEAVFLINGLLHLSENPTIRQIRYLIDAKREVDTQARFSHHNQLGSLELKHPHRRQEYVFDRGVYIFVDYQENKLQTMQRLLIGRDGVDIYSDVVDPGYIEHNGNKFVLSEYVKKSNPSRIHRFLTYMKRHPERKVHGWVPVMNYL